MSDSIVSATLVRSPRRNWTCDSCNAPMGMAKHIRLYGAAHSHEKPYTIRICIRCADGCAETSAKIRAALGGDV